MSTLTTGSTEYSRDGRFKPHPAQQLFITIHPRRKKPQRRWIEVGVPEEGTLYLPPSPEARGRQRYRIRAVSERIER